MTEERAELLASGLTYQQAADALFVSPKTVQWNVSKIYRKLVSLAGRADPSAARLRRRDDPRSGGFRAAPCRSIPASPFRRRHAGVRRSSPMRGRPRAEGSAMNTNPIPPGPPRIPVDYALLRANRAQRGRRRRFAALRAVAARLRRVQR